MATLTDRRPDQDTDANIDENNPVKRRQATAESLSSQEQQGAYVRDVRGTTLPDSYNRSETPGDIGTREEAGYQPSYANNFTGKNNPGGLKAKLKNFTRKKGAMVAIIALISGGAGLPFLGVSSLPFSILGNMSAKSITQQLTPFSDDYDRFMLFGIKGSNPVKIKAGQISGLTQAQIDKIKAADPTVKFEPSSGNKTKSGKFTFNSIEVGGVKINATNYNSTIRANPTIRKTLRVSKPSLWKASKSAAGASVKRLFRINVNPDVVGASEVESNRKLVQESVEGTTADVRGSVNSDANTTEPDPVKTSETSAVADNFSEQIDEAKKAVAEGKSSRPPLAMNNVGTLLSGDATDIDTLVGKSSLGSQVFGFVNSLDVADTICTLYQTAYTANVAARSLAMANFVRYGFTFITSFEKAMAGDDNTGQVNYLLSILNRKDPDTGLAFDSSSYASFLFNGELSSEPSAVSALGGQGMLALITGMHAIHTIAGFGSPANGRVFLKTSCGIATNLLAQVGVSIGSIIIGIFTGGTSLAAAASSSTAVKVGLREGMKVIVKKMTETAGQKVRESISKNLGKDALKQLPKKSWTGFRSVSSKLSKWDKLGILLAGVSLFGMDYIVKALSGEGIVDTIQNGFATMDSVGMARQQVDFATTIAAGGSIATYSQARAALPQLLAYEDRYNKTMGEDARSTPFDISNPYSALGSVASSAQKTIGLSSSMTLGSSLRSVFKLTTNAPALLMGSVAAAANAPTPESIGEYVGDDYSKENKLAQQVTGSYTAVMNKKYSYSDILEKLVFNDKPQIQQTGVDSKTGEPILEIIPGTELADYQQLCHNPQRLVPDPEYAEDDTKYDTDCIEGRSKYNALYSNAISYITVGSPDSTDTNILPASSTQSNKPTVSGDMATLAKIILANSGNSKTFRFDYAPSQDIPKRSTAELQLKDMAAGKLPLTSTTRCGFNKPSPVTPDIKLLQFLADVAQHSGLTGIQINSLFGQCHSVTSDHYKGAAVDIGCNNAATTGSAVVRKMDSIGASYGYKRNWETCPNPDEKHWHYGPLG